MPGFPLKIVHDKYNQKTEMDDLIKDFEYSLSLNKDMESSLKKAYEDLDPLKVFNIFKRIRDEDVILFDMDPALCRPIDMLIT